MSATSDRVRVGSADELPPGRGKTVVVGGREITVYNSEGRLVATAAAPRLSGAGPNSVESPCAGEGHHFTVGQAMSPDRLRADDRRYTVTVEDGDIFVEPTAS